MNKTFRIAFGGIVSALCVVLMLCTGLFPFATVALPALAGVMMIPVVVELGVKWAYLVYAAVAVVSVFVTPELSAMLMFVFFFGYYPIVKSSIERIHKSMLEWAMKFLIVNAALIVLYLLARWIFSLNVILPDLRIFGKFTFLVFWFAANVAFFIYDIALTRLAAGYIRWFKPKYLDKFERRGR